MPAKTTDALFDAPKVKRGGPVYQGVCKELRALEAADPALTDQRAGLLALARSLSARVDQAMGWDGRRPESGMQSAALVERLVDVLGKINPFDEADPDDGFARLLDELGPGVNRDRPAPAPHSED